MKIRTLTFFHVLSGNDLAYLPTIIHEISMSLEILRINYEKEGFTVQTARISFNSFEEWLTDKNSDFVLANLEESLSRNNIEFCSLGPAKSVKGIKLFVNFF